MEETIIHSDDPYIWELWSADKAKLYSRDYTHLRLALTHEPYQRGYAPINIMVKLNDFNPYNEVRSPTLFFHFIVTHFSLYCLGYLSQPAKVC